MQPASARSSARLACWIAVPILALLGGCDHLPGRPEEAERYLRPSHVKDFTDIYAENCAGCHGDDARPGAAVALSDPVYLAVADDASIQHAISVGVPGTPMPGFANSAGGSLTDEQIRILVQGMRSRWAKSGVVTETPPYNAPPGDAGRGTQVFATYCASCHGTDGKGGPKGGSVVDGSYLALVSNQGLRTSVIVGRPRLGMLDWRGLRRPPSEDNKMISDAEISDVVAWLISKRVPFPGQPYARAE